MSKILVVLFLNSIFPMLSIANDCDEFKNDCQYYLCMEDKKHCGENGYFKNLGHKYCHKFSQFKDSSSPELDNFVEETRNCLIDQITTIPIGTTCRKFKNLAYRQHVPCYIKSGFCELSFKDKRKVIYSIKGALWRPLVFKDGLRLLFKCR